MPKFKVMSVDPLSSCSNSQNFSGGRCYKGTVFICTGDNMVIAFVLLTLAPGQEEEIAETLSKKDLVQECHVVYGEYDIHLSIEAEDLHSLDEFIHEIRLLEGIGHSTTLIAVGE